MIKAVLLPFGIIKSLQDAILGLKSNRDNERTLHNHVKMIMPSIREGAKNYSDSHIGYLTEKHEKYVSWNVLGNGEIHAIAEGMGTTYIQFDQEKSEWSIWRNDCPPEERLRFKNLSDATKGQGQEHLISKSQIDVYLRVRFLRAIKGEIDLLIEMLN